MAESSQVGMDKFTHKAGDVLPNGIKIVSVIRGTVADTFAGYRCRVILGLNTQGHRVYGNEVIVPNLDGMSDPRYFPGGTGLEQIEMLSNPDASRVYYYPPGEDQMECCSVSEFNAMVNGKPEPVEDVPEKKICAAKTKAGEPCKRTAVEGEIYCSSHME